MRNWIMAILALSVCIGAASTSFAGNKGGKKHSPEAMFKDKDTNNDGKLSLDEYKAGLPADKAAKADKAFKKMDTDGDGSVTLTEFEAFMKDHHKGAEKKAK